MKALLCAITVILLSIVFSIIAVYIMHLELRVSEEASAASGVSMKTDLADLRATIERLRDSIKGKKERKDQNKLSPWHLRVDIWIIIVEEILLTF